MIRKVKKAIDLARSITRKFVNLKYLMIIVGKLKLLKENPSKHSRVKLGKDAYRNSCFPSRLRVV